MALYQLKSPWPGESCPACRDPTPQAWTPRCADTGYETALKQIIGRKRVLKQQQIFRRSLLNSSSHWWKQQRGSAAAFFFKLVTCQTKSWGSYLLNYLAVVKLVKVAGCYRASVLGNRERLSHLKTSSKGLAGKEWSSLSLLIVCWCPLCSRHFRGAEVTGLWFQHPTAAV